MSFWSSRFIRWSLIKLRSGLEWAWVRSFGVPLVQPQAAKTKTRKKKR